MVPNPALGAAVEHRGDQPDTGEVTVTPPRAGSFVYHTHVSGLRPQSGGLRGALNVLRAGETWDPSSNLQFITGTNPTDDPVRNGSASPPELTLNAGRSYRVRRMNISLDVPLNDLWLTAAMEGRTGAGPVYARQAIHVVP